MTRKHLWILLLSLGTVACDQSATSPSNTTALQAPRYFRRADVSIDPVTALFHLTSTGGFVTSGNEVSSPVDTMIEQPFWFTASMPFSTIDSQKTGELASGSTKYSGESPTSFDFQLKWSNLPGIIDSLVISHSKEIYNSWGPCLGCPYGSDYVSTRIRLSNIAITDSTSTSITVRIPIAVLTSNPGWIQWGDYLEHVEPARGVSLKRDTVLNKITQFNDTSKLVIRLTR
ncbi:MAG: hypothetical protein JSS75_10430 [Bacteroidetes bacterium]|nr:hypothetical protein [Bacteroidota bacterium]